MRDAYIGASMKVAVTNQRCSRDSKYWPSRSTRAQISTATTRYHGPKLPLFINIVLMEARRPRLLKLEVGRIIFSRFESTLVRTHILSCIASNNCRAFAHARILYTCGHDEYTLQPRRTGSRPVGRKVQAALNFKVLAIIVIPIAPLTYFGASTVSVPSVLACAASPPYGLRPPGAWSHSDRSNPVQVWSFGDSDSVGPTRATNQMRAQSTGTVTRAPVR